MDIIVNVKFRVNALIGNDIIPYLQSQRRGFTISEDPQN